MKITLPSITSHALGMLFHMQMKLIYSIHIAIVRLMISSLSERTYMIHNKCRVAWIKIAVFSAEPYNEDNLPTLGVSHGSKI